MWCHCIAIAKCLEGEFSLHRLFVADVESFAERMFLHAPTCSSRHHRVSHRDWPVMFMQPVDDAQNVFLITDGVTRVHMFLKNTQVLCFLDFWLCFGADSV